MQRRALLATLGLLGTGGCLRLQQADVSGTGTPGETGGSAQPSGSDTASNAGDASAGTSSAGTASDGTGTDERGVTLTEAWTADEGAEHVWTDASTFFFSTYAEAGAASVADGLRWDADATSGEVDGSSVETFALDDERAVFGFSPDSNGDAGAYFCAFDRASGERLWTLDAPADGAHHAAEGAALVDGTAVVAASDYGSQSDQDPLVYGVDAATGEELWRTGTPDVPAGFVSNVVAHGGAVFVVFGSQGARVLDPSTGSVTATYDSMWTEMWTGYAHGGTLYAAWDGEALAYSLDDGSEKWSASSGGGRGRIPPAVDDGLVVFGTKTSFVTAFDAESGEQRWQKRTADPVYGVALSDGYAWAIDEGGVLTGFARDDGTKVHESTQGDADSDVAAADGVLLVGGETANAYRVEDS
ncbi:PQQ-binding-like beta-propeller repeat protein [Salinirarus marinus]|uniref:PQQ-binding-like beta-propeller repeat protein n=1 Tax=Salinirarus marinus TaxID=3068310 RepID=UPI003C6C872B